MTVHSNQERNRLAQIVDDNEIDQVLGSPPNWLVYWGITIVFIAILILGFLAWFIKYPDIISAEVKIMTENPAIRIVPKTSGKINQLLINNGQDVEVGAVLAIIDSPAELKDIDLVQKMLEQAANGTSYAFYLNLTPLENLSLGSLQTGYTLFVQQLKTYQYLLKQEATIQKIQALENHIIQLYHLNENLKNQQETLKIETTLAEKNYKRNWQLHKNNVISASELEKIEIQFLQYKRQLDGIDNQIISNKINIEQTKVQVIDLKQQRTDGLTELETALQQHIQNLLAEISIWKENYLIKAPIAGKVSFSTIWSEQQFVKANEEVFTVVPTQGYGEIIGKVTLPEQNSGKVNINQVAHVYLNGFPYQEYGTIKSEITNISLVPEENNYLLEIQFPDGLKTNYDHSIPFRQEMQGKVNIITEDRRVLERIFDQFINLLRAN